MTDAAGGWRSRITGQGSKPASEFLANPSNWRTHPQNQRDAVHASLSEVGWVQQVIENVRTGHLVDGHERVWQALKHDDQDVPYLQVDLSEDEERLVLATLDPMAAMAGADAGVLAELLAGIETESEALQALLDGLAGEHLPPEEWPEYDEGIADEVEYLECPECGHKWPK